MSKDLEKIYSFSCPRWNDLPDMVFSSEIVYFFNKRFSILLDENEELTQDMIRNYVKWNMVDPPRGRKYSRDQLAIIICICIFKEVISIKDIVTGASLQKKIMDAPTAYNMFSDKLEKSLKKVFGPVLKENKGELVFEKYRADDENIGLSTLTNAFSFRLLAREIIKKRGFKNII